MSAGRRPAPLWGADRGRPNRRPDGRADAVLFDLDGLLIDSEPVWYAVEAEVMHRLGARWTPQDQEACIGGPVNRSIAYMRKLAGRRVSVQRLREQLLAGMVARLRTDVPLRPGGLELVDAVRAAGVPTALVSASYRTLVDAALQRLRAERFDVTIAGDEVTQSKPDPEPYLAACACLSARPARCVVLEDSPVGAESGQRAGCVVVVVPSVAMIEPAVRRVVLDSLDGVDPDWLLALPERVPDGQVKGR